MAWQSFEVRPMFGAAAVAEQLRRQLEVVLAIRLPLGVDVAVFRRDRLDSVRYFFSSAAVEIFKTLVQFHGGKPCRRPAVTRRTVKVVPPPSDRPL